MFGYITIDPNMLSKEDKTQYRSYYCGLCKRLGEVHGLNGRMTLTYDVTFVALLLSSVYCEKETVGLQRCMMHPLHSHEYICALATDYAADLNMILAYCKCFDDWNDDKNVVALGGSQILRGKVEQAAARWPRQYAAIVNGIADLSRMEKHNEMNPDLPANCFGVIMGELFIRKEDEYAATLRKMGVTVAMTEEIIFRGFITNKLFGLKQNGFRTVAAVAISAVVFGFIHIDAALVNLLRFGMIPPIESIAGPFIYTLGCGVSWAVILYYKKDIVSLACIHFTINILVDAYTLCGESLWLGVLYLATFIAFVVCYPAILLFKAWRAAKGLRSA